MEAYFKFKLAWELAPIVIFIVISIISFVIYCFEEWNWQRKIRYLQSLGFERYLKDVASVGNKCWYGWQRDTGDLFWQTISEEEIKMMTYKELKEEFQIKESKTL